MRGRQQGLSQRKRCMMEAEVRVMCAEYRGHLQKLERGKNKSLALPKQCSSADTLILSCRPSQTSDLQNCKIPLSCLKPLWAFQVALVVKNPTASAGDIRDVGLISEWGTSVEEGSATHSSILPLEIPWTEEPGRLQSMGSQRVTQD